MIIQKKKSQAHKILLDQINYIMMEMYQNKDSVAAIRHLLGNGLYEGFHRIPHLKAPIMLSYNELVRGILPSTNDGNYNKSQ